MKSTEDIKQRLKSENKKLPKLYKKYCSAKNEEGQSRVRLQMWKKDGVISTLEWILKN